MTKSTDWQSVEKACKPRKLHLHPRELANLIRWMRGGDPKNTLFIYAASLRMGETLRALILRAVGRYVCAQKKPRTPSAPGKRFALRRRTASGGCILFLCVGMGRGLNALGRAGGPD